jgi:hypothetical protein
MKHNKYVTNAARDRENKKKINDLFPMVQELYIF